MTLQEYFKRQSESIIAQLFPDDASSGSITFPQFWVAIENVDNFSVRQQGRLQDWTRHADTGGVLIYRNAFNFPELWIDPEKLNWRPVFLNYLRDFFSVEDAVPPDQHVDHLFNRSRAIVQKLSYVRLALVEGGSNVTWGSSVEKLLTEQARSIQRGKFIRQGTDFMVAKLHGIAPPDWEKPAADELARIAQALFEGPYKNKSSYELVLQVLSAQYEWALRKPPAVS